MLKRILRLGAGGRIKDRQCGVGLRAIRSREQILRLSHFEGRIVRSPLHGATAKLDGLLPPTGRCRQIGAKAITKRRFGDGVMRSCPQRRVILLSLPREKRRLLRQYAFARRIKGGRHGKLRCRISLPSKAAVERREIQPRRDILGDSRVTLSHEYRHQSR